MRSPRKLVAIVVDGLAPAALDRAVAAGAAPTLQLLRERGDGGLGVSVFPSLTPVCLSAIATGAGPGLSRIPALHWYHRGERRFVEYGSSFEATVVAGAKQCVDDSMSNLNHLHLSPKVETVFESVEDAGFVAGSINFYVWRGRVRHPIRSPFVRGFARRTGFFDAAYGPTRFFFGELFGSDRTGAPRNLGVGGRNDDQAGAIGRWLVERDAFDFLLFYLPDTDSASHRYGPEGVTDAVARADANIAKLFSACGGAEAFLERYRVILAADHAQSAVDRDDDVREAFADQRLFVSRTRSDADACDLAVAASNRAAMVYRLAGGPDAEEIALRLGRPAVGRRGGLARGWPRRRPARRPQAALRSGRAERGRPRRPLDGRGRPRRARARGGARAALRDLPQCARAAVVAARPASTPARSWPRPRRAGSSATPAGRATSAGARMARCTRWTPLVPLAFVGVRRRTCRRCPAQRSICRLAPVVRSHFGIRAAAA